MRKKKLLLFLTNFICLLGFSQTVDFKYSTITGLFCHPQKIKFTQNCTGNPIRYIWNFGNGQGGTNTEENITYAIPGTYIVQLIAIYENDAISIKKSIVINRTPVVLLSADRSILCLPGTVLFTTTGSPFITSYEWDFGDGTPILVTGSGSTSHTYTGYNIFTARVKAKTAFGCYTTDTHVINISRISISGNVMPPDGCIPVNALLTITAGLQAGDSIRNITWHFSDGSPDVNNITNPINHTYNITTPIVNAGVVVTTASGCSNQYTFPGFGYGTPPFGTEAKTQSGRDTFCASEKIDMVAVAINADKYKWDFGDGSYSTAIDSTIAHKYASLGLKHVVVTPYFNNCPGQKDSFDIFIQGVIAVYNISNTCTQKNKFSFINNSSGHIDHFEWLFSDTPGIIDSTNFSVIHTFPLFGAYDVKLFLIDSLTGCRDSLVSPIAMAGPVFNRSKDNVCKDSLIIYRVSNTYPPGYDFEYEFHVNGQVVNNGADSVLNLIASDFGSFFEYVVIKDARPGTCSDSLYLLQNVNVGGPFVDFSIPSQLCGDTSMKIINNSLPHFPQDIITFWHWDFGDNKTDSIKDPAPHVYVTTDTFTVSLIVEDINGCKQKSTRSIIILPYPSINTFPQEDTICLRDTAVLRAYSVDTIMWFPNTNINCTSCDTVKVFPNITTKYIARAINTSGCKSYDTSLVRVYLPFKVKVIPADTAICPGQAVNYDLDQTGITRWSPATYLNHPTVKNPQARPPSSTNYMVTVSDSLSCFVDTAFAVLKLHDPPIVDAGPDKILPYNTTFTMNPVYSSDITSFLWNTSANLSCLTCPNPDGIALQKKEYRIEVMNKEGCKSADSLTVFIRCFQAYLLMPNSFTPNNDGKNDYFYPITRGYRNVKVFTIFNRMGNKVFERYNFDPNIPAMGWDGSVKGSHKGSTEVFTWFLEAKCETGELYSTKGTVILIR